jgi:hypothetical protein
LLIYEFKLAKIPSLSESGSSIEWKSADLYNNSRTQLGPQVFACFFLWVLALWQRVLAIASERSVRSWSAISESNGPSHRRRLCLSQTRFQFRSRPNLLAGNFSDNFSTQ